MGMLLKNLADIGINIEADERGGLMVHSETPLSEVAKSWLTDNKARLLAEIQEPAQAFDSDDIIAAREWIAWNDGANPPQWVIDALRYSEVSPTTSTSPPIGTLTPRVMGTSN
jgi:hypothetical protein